MAPVSSSENPSRFASARATLDLPAPAGPSMATTGATTAAGGGEAEAGFEADTAGDHRSASAALSNDGKFGREMARVPDSDSVGEPSLAAAAWPPVDVRRREWFLRVVLLGAGATLLGMLSARAGPTWRGLLTLAPLVPLAIGLRAFQRGAAADGWLLFGVPVALAVGQPYAPDRADPIFFCTWAAVLVGYLVQAARLLRTPRLTLHLVRKGRQGEDARRLRRRVRFYDALLVLCVVTFAYPMARALTAGGPPLAAIAAAGLLSVVAARAFLIDSLDRHLQRDPALVQALDRLRRHARRGRPDASFYLVAFVALAAMALFVLRERLP